MPAQAATLRIRGGVQPAEQRTSLEFRGPVLRTGLSATVVSSACATLDPFVAVGHEYHVLNREVVPREEESEMRPIPQQSSGERYRGPRGRLLTFKKQR